jgi:hypothetical protein
MSVTEIRNHFVNWREWELNPIVIKELRQAVRSWAVTGMLLLFLTVLFITSLVFLVTQSIDGNVNLQLGGSMFSAFVAILTGASLCFIPLYIGVRVTMERRENNSDLLYVSTLSPARIIRGKFFCGAYMALLFFSVCMPFMAFTNLLRGVDLPTVFFILTYLFLVVCAVNQVAIFFACVPASLPLKILLGLLGLVVSFWGVVPLVYVSYEFMRSGVGVMMGERYFWIGAISTIGIGVAVTGLFYILSVALISPPSANRARPVRIYLTVIWLLGGLLGAAWMLKTGKIEPLFLWTYLTYALMIVSLLVTISNSDTLSFRVRRTIPQSRWKRAVAFLFFNGAAGGLIWVALISGLTFFVTNLGLKVAPSTGAAASTFPLFYSTTMAYAFAYALTALIICRKFFPRRPPKIAGVLAVLLAGGWAIAPGIVLFFLNRLSWKSLEGLQPGNVFNVASTHDSVQQLDHLYCACGWLLVMVVINAKWFCRQARNFQPPTATPPPPVPNETAPAAQ